MALDGKVMVSDRVGHFLVHYAVLHFVWFWRCWGNVLR